jgi:hypothetical protein
MGIDPKAASLGYVQFSWTQARFKGSFGASTGNDSRNPQMNDASKMETEDVLRVELAELRREHRDLDDAIAALQDSRRADQLRLRRLKKQKLMLKDKISRLEDLLTPDIIA